MRIFLLLVVSFASFSFLSACGNDVAAEPTLPDPEPTFDQAWDFKPESDAFSNDALLDLRFLNEKRAGESGFIRLSKDGMSFVRGDGQPIRFWSVVSGLGMSPEEMDYHCRFLAKRGVNMARLHTNIAGRDEGQSITDIDFETIDRIHRFVKAAQDAGIYVVISPYWYHHRIPESWTQDLEGYKKGDMPAGALFFNPKFQDAYKTWVRALMTRKNPYTDIPLKDDPSVAIFQVKNEDSTLFWTFQNLPEPQKRILGKQFYDWAVKKYGSLANAYRAWGDLRLKTDDPQAQVLGLHITWFHTIDAQRKLQARLRDELAFTVHLQKAFYENIHDFVKDELKCQQLINTNNWKSASTLRLDDLERWTYTAGDVMAVNRYTGGRHLGKNNGFRIDPGHHIVNRSILHHPLQLPTNLKQPIGYPMLITESTWVRPNLYQSEGPLLASAYLSLTGVDSLFWFSVAAPDWNNDPRRTFNLVTERPAGYALNKWSSSVPLILGMFPANALLYRQGYIAAADPVVIEHRTMSDLLNQKTPRIAETISFDPNRDTEDLRDQQESDTDISRLAFLVGPVQVKYDSESSRSQVADLNRFINGEDKTVQSATRELLLNWELGLFTMNAPKARGVTGFLKKAGGRFDLGGLIIASTNDYASVQVTAMDDRALEDSRKLLVQVGTLSRLTDWKTEPALFEDGESREAGHQIIATGQPPYRILNTQVSLALKNPHISKAILLNVNGEPVREVDLVRAEDRLSLRLPAETMYLMLTE